MKQFWDSVSSTAEVEIMTPGLPECGEDNMEYAESPLTFPLSLKCKTVRPVMSAGQKGPCTRCLRSDTGTPGGTLERTPLPGSQLPSGALWSPCLQLSQRQETAGGRHLVSKTAGEQAGEGSGTPGHKVRHSVRAWRGFPLKMTFKGKYWGTFSLKIKYWNHWILKNHTVF